MYLGFDFTFGWAWWIETQILAPKYVLFWLDQKKHIYIHDHKYVSEDKLKFTQYIYDLCHLPLTCIVDPEFMKSEPTRPTNQRVLVCHT